MKKIFTTLAILGTIAIASAQSNLSLGGTGWATSTKGDLLVGTSSTLRYTRLPIGSTGNVLWVLNGQPAWVATSSLGITGGGSGTVSSVSVNTPTGLTAATTTCNTICLIALSLQGGYIIPLIASTTEWATFYTTPSTRITAGTNLSWSGNTLNVTGGGFFATTSVNGLATTTFLFSTGVGGSDFNIATSTTAVTFNLPTASVSNRGALSTTDWSTFNNKLGQFFNVASGTGLTIGNLFSTSSLTVLGLLRDSTNASGTSGQVLLSTGTSTLWTSTSSLGISGSLSGGTTGWLPYWTSATTLGAVATGTVGQVLTASSTSASGYGWSTITGGAISINGASASSFTFATGTAGTNFNIATTSGTVTFNIPDASASARGLITTGIQTIAGSKTLSGQTTTIGGGIILSFTGTPGTLSAGDAYRGASQGEYYLGSSGVTGSGFNIGNGNSFVGYSFSSKTSNGFAGSSNPLLAQVGIKPLIISQFGATTTDTASLYVEGAATSTTNVTGNNYSLWIDNRGGGGKSRISGGLYLTDDLHDSTNASGTSGQILSSTGTSTKWITSGGSGTVTSVDMTVPTGLTISGNPITTAGTLALALQSGYIIPLIASTTEWATAFASTTNITPTWIRNLFSNTVTGLTYTTATGVTSLTAGYVIPLTASTTEWANFYTTPSTRITAGTNLSWSGNTLNASGGVFSTSSINGLATTTFVFSTSSDTNIGLNISTSSTGVLFAPTWIGTLADGRIASSATWNAKLGQFFNVASGTGLTIGNLFSTSSMTILGTLRDSTNASGTLGQLLQSTGTSTIWVSTSSLGITGGTTYTGTYPIIVTGSVISTGFSTSTTNIFSNAQTINNTLNVTGTSTFATTTISTSTITNLNVPNLLSVNNSSTTVGTIGTIFNTTRLYLRGLLSDSTDATGTLGQLLQSTGTSTLWVSTSSLGISGSLSGGVNGKNAYWTSASTLGASGDVFDNGTVSGVNATSSTVNFNVQGTGTNDPFNVASSSGASLFKVFSSGKIGFGTTTFLSTEFAKIDASTTYNSPLSLFCNKDDFCQNLISNISLGSSTWSGFTAQNASSTATSTFARIGINGSKFSTSTTYSVGGISDVTFIGTGNNMYVANGSSTALLGFLTGGTSTTTNQRMTITSLGNVGIGTTTAGTKFSVASSTGAVFSVADTVVALTDFMLQIASSTNYFFGVQGNGHVTASSTSPTLSSCGTTPTIRGNDSWGEITVGSVSASGCTLTFANVYTNAPSCVISNQSMSITNTLTYTISTTTLTLSQTGLTSAKVNYHCFGIGE